jgi:hypothetical protein
MKVAFSGKARSGKDTAVSFAINHMLDNHDIHSYELRFAEALYKITDQIQEILQMPNCKDPKLLQFIGEGLRQHYGETIFVNIVEKKYQRIMNKEENNPEKTNIFVSDLRYKEEANMLRKNGFIIIRIDRWNRPIDRDPYHKSETDLDDYHFDYTINNDGTLAEFKKKLKDVVESHFENHVSIENTGT